MRLPRTILKAIAAAVVTSCAVAGRAQDSGTPRIFPDFSATQEMGNLPPGRVYQSGSNFRVEQIPGLTVIYLAASNKVYDLFSRGNCIQLSPDKESRVPIPLQLLTGSKVERTPVGAEVVDGHTCKVENVVVTTAEGKVTQSKVWEAQDLKGAPVKIESLTPRGKVVATYHDIILGTPDPALFKPPSPCAPEDKMYQVAPQRK
ncbi:MAG: hypothetical protein WB566_05435 [Terriglobales bacterium]